MGLIIKKRMKYTNIVILFLSLFVTPLYAQLNSTESIELGKYVLKLAPYKAAINLSKEMTDAFKINDMTAVARLKENRNKLLNEVIDSLFSVRSDARTNIAVADIVASFINYSDCAAVEKMLSRFDASLSSVKLDATRLEIANDKRVAIGQPAMDFVLKDKNDKKYSFKNFKGKYLFLEFSASWCGWCKQETPFIREAYEKYKENVVFITVYLDDNREKWLNDMDTHKIEWLGLSDLMGWKSPIVSDYCIQGVPNCYLLDENRRIVGRGMRGKQIVEKIENELKNRK